MTLDFLLTENSSGATEFYYYLRTNPTSLSCHAWSMEKSIFIAYSFISPNSGDAEKQNILQSFSEIKYQTNIATAFLVRQRAS